MESALFVTVGKELENRYLDSAKNIMEAGIDAECGAKGLPEAPCGMRGIVALRRAAGTHRFLNSAAVSAEPMEGVRRCSCQDMVWGYKVGD